MMDLVLIAGRISDNMQGLHNVLHQAAATVLTSDLLPSPQLIADNQPELLLIGRGIATEQAQAFVARVRDCSPATAIVGISPAPQGDGLGPDSFDEQVEFGLDETVLRKLLDRLGAQRERKISRYFGPDCPPGVGIVGKSPAIIKVLEMIRIVSQSRCNPILVLGETGTGKELAARAVHAWRHGSRGKFVAVNCATLTANLLESELFGHVKGAFTGADREKTGLLEIAEDGSIFLDEISELPLELQAKLLRFLQEKTFRKVGGTADIASGATIIASSNWALFEQVKARRFREDLYYRLAVFPIKIPPLRSPDRRSDIGLLCEYFIETARSGGQASVVGLTPEAQHQLMIHDWPGNVRELRNVIERALILERGPHIVPASLAMDHVAEAKVAPGAGPTAPANPYDFSLEAAEREFICRALGAAKGQRTRAASLLGITRATLLAKIKRYNIATPSTTAD